MSSQPDTTHRIVVGIDASPPSIAALEWAAHQAELTGAKLEVLMMWEWPTSYGWSLPVPSEYDPEQDAAKALDERASRSHHPARRPRGPPGPPAGQGVTRSGPPRGRQPRSW
jgi:nucleotide-binding universal stress UspA family protein